jgi:hypothetical protein
MTLLPEEASENWESPEVMWALICEDVIFWLRL